MDGNKPKRSFGRKLGRILLICLILIVVCLAALPTLLSTAPIRSFAVSKVNQAVAPSRVEIRSMSLSWFGSTELRGLTLKNKAGKLLIDAESAVLNRGLVALALNHSKLGVLSVGGAKVDIERKSDGSIDLVDALVPPSPAPQPQKAVAAPSSGPGIDLVLKVTSGSLTLRSPELAAPIVADSLTMEVVVPSTPKPPLSWKIRLGKPKGGDGTETLGIDGSYDYLVQNEPALDLTVHGKMWPFAGNVSGISATGKLQGAIEYGQKGASLKTVGDAILVDLIVQGGALSGDVLKLENVGGSWDLGQSSTGWTIRHLDFKAPFANLQGKGEVAADSSLPNVHVVGSVDLAMLSKQIPKTLRLREGLSLEKGSADLSVELKSENGVQTASLDAGISELSALDGQKAFTLKDNATVNLKGSRSATGFALENLRIKTVFLDVLGQGDLAKGLTLSGNVDLSLIQAQFRDLIDFKGVELAGKGRMAGDYRKTGETFTARYAAEVKGLKVGGLTTEPVVRDDVRFDVAANGPVDASGLPTTLDIAKANLKSSQDSITVAAQLHPETLTLNAVASMPMKVMTRDGRVDVKLLGKYHFSPSILDIDELRLGLKPVDPALNGEGSIAFAASGRLDLEGDEIQLNPLPMPAGSAVTLGAEGMKIHGLYKTPNDQRAARILLSGDLGAIDRALNVWNGSELYGLGGTFNAMVGMGPGGPGIINLGGDINSPDLTMRSSDGKTITQEGPLAVAYRAGYVLEADRLDFSKLIVDAKWARIEAEGSLGEPTGRRVANLKGVLTPNWQTLSGILRESVEPNAVLTGDPRSFHVMGILSGDSLVGIMKGLDGEIGLNLTAADAFGMKLGPAPIVVHLSGGNATVDEIKSTLNTGVVDLKPGLTLDEKNGISLVFYSGTKIQGAAINDEVSRRVLRYVAPVLDKATEVTGKINLDIENGEIPLTGPPERTMTLNGLLAFQDVDFAPGPFANQVLSVVGKQNSKGLKIQEPINLSIANSRVIQKGLTIPIGGNATIDLAGSVGFDETLDLKAGLPLNPKMLGQVSGLDNLVDGKKITVPIGGTVSHPNINRQALQVALKGMLKDGLSKEAGGYLDKIVPGASDMLKAKGGQGGADPGGAGSDPLKNLEGEFLKRIKPKR